VSLLFDALNSHDGGSTFAELIARPPWMLDALCREHPEVTWFPKQGEDVTAAKAVCARCLVRAECAAYSLGEAHGIWAGTAAHTRVKLRRSAA
jgi:WhiB family redox-sensing transcriptional regulator